MGIFSNKPAKQTPSVVVKSSGDPTKRTVTKRSRQFVEAPVEESTGLLSVFTNVNPQARALTYNAPRTLTAAAAIVNTNSKQEFEQFQARKASGSSSWQQEAWEYYDAIGEIKYAFSLVASVISRIRIFAAVVDNPAEAPVTVRNSTIVPEDLAAAAERALSRLDSAYGGQPGLLHNIALNLSVAGECYLVQMPASLANGTAESWDIKSIDEVVTTQRAGYSIIGRREQAIGGALAGNGATALGPNAFVGRIWRSHPRYSDEADCSMRGILDMCSELLLLNRTFRATARSRLNAGALYLPDGLSVAAQGDPGVPYDDENDLNPGVTAEESEDEFEEALIEAMTTPIRQEDSASAVVPLIIRGPAELGDKIKQFKFERSFDPALAERSDRVLDRILQGIDVPKDIITGLANVKYSNALQIDEGLYKAHIEPLMLLIVDAFTVVYLHPYLIAHGYDAEDVDKVVVWYDPSAIATRNDRAADADAGYDRNAISGEAWRRAHGFSEVDAPNPTEFALRFLNDKGVLTPELTEAILQSIAPDLMGAVRTAQQATSAGPLPPAVEDALQGEPTSDSSAPTGSTSTTPAAPSTSADVPTPAPAPAPADAEADPSSPFTPPAGAS